MRGREIELWQRFLVAHPDRFTELEYDVRVGQGAEIPAGFTPSLNRMAEALTKQRIDAIGTSGADRTIVEVAPSAGTDSLGQLLVYRQLWASEHPGEVQPKLMLVTDVDRPDIRSVAQAEAVELVIV